MSVEAQCQDCQESFPSELVQSAFLNGEYRNLCGVCALEAVRKIHGRPHYMFRGEMALEVYRQCLAIKTKRQGDAT